MPVTVQEGAASRWKMTGSGGGRGAGEGRETGLGASRKRQDGDDGGRSQGGVEGRSSQAGTASTIPTAELTERGAMVETWLTTPGGRLTEM